MLLPHPSARVASSGARWRRTTRTPYPLCRKFHTTEACGAPP